MLEDFNFDDKDTMEQFDQKLKEKLGIGIAECAEALNKSIMEKADELVIELPNIAPSGDYGKLIEDKEGMSSFLKEESIKPGSWVLQFLEVKNKDSGLIELVFFNKTVDDGDILKGFVFVGKSGKIRHAFVQIHS